MKSTLSERVDSLVRDGWRIKGYWKQERVQEEDQDGSSNVPLCDSSRPGSTSVATALGPSKCLMRLTRQRRDIWGMYDLVRGSITTKIRARLMLPDAT